MLVVRYQSVPAFNFTHKKLVQKKRQLKLKILNCSLEECNCPKDFLMNFILEHVWEFNMLLEHVWEFHMLLLW